MSKHDKPVFVRPVKTVNQVSLANGSFEIEFTFESGRVERLKCDATCAVLLQSKLQLSLAQNQMGFSNFSVAYSQTQPYVALICQGANDMRMDLVFNPPEAQLVGTKLAEAGKITASYAIAAPAPMQPHERAN